MLTAILFILMLLILIIPHEFGHFIVAKLTGVKVNEFSVGMGPLLKKWQKGDTQYSVRLLPIGGYCAMEGEESSVDAEDSFTSKSLPQKLAILLAGVVMNFILAIIIMISVYSIVGISTNVIGDISDKSPAKTAGIMAGDKILAIDGNKTKTWDDTINYISQYDGQGTLKVEVLRDKKSLSFDVTPSYNSEEKRYLIGISTSFSRSPVYVVPNSFGACSYYTKEIFKAFFKLITFRLNKDDISGPVGMVKAVGQTKSMGISAYLLLLAIVSLNLAVFNLLPIPGLDGGKIIIVILRRIIGPKFTDDTESLITMIGFAILIGLIIFVTVNDVIRLF